VAFLTSNSAEHGEGIPASPKTSAANASNPEAKGDRRPSFREISSCVASMGD